MPQRGPVMMGHFQALTVTVKQKVPDQPRAGAVLLETLLALPLFIVLIGGMMWIGDLSAAKQKMVLADRYLVWNLGNRHRVETVAERPRRIRDEIMRTFFDQDASKSVLTGSVLGSVRRWSHEAYGGAGLAMSAPSWTAGWLGVGKVVWDGDLDLATRLPVLRGRDVPPGPSGRYEGHCVVIRSRYVGTRHNDMPINAGGPLTIDFESIRQESWADDYMP